jgi:hypothetical protein
MVARLHQETEDPEVNPLGAPRGGASDGGAPRDSRMKLQAL